MMSSERLSVILLEGAGGRSCLPDMTEQAASQGGVSVEDAWEMC